MNKHNEKIKHSIVISSINLSFTSQSPDKNILNTLFFIEFEDLNFLIPPNH